MSKYDEYNFKESSKFISVPAQIDFHIDRFRDTNEKAISANTMAIIEQTERLEAIISAQTIVQHNDSIAMKEQQAADAELGRITIKSAFSNLISGFKKIFSKEDNDGNITKSFYDMVKEEHDQTQEYFSSYTNTFKEESDETQSSITTTNEKLQSIVKELQDIEFDIESNTSGDATNADAIKNAINNIKLIMN